VETILRSKLESLESDELKGVVRALADLTEDESTQLLNDRALFQRGDRHVLVTLSTFIYIYTHILSTIKHASDCYRQHICMDSFASNAPFAFARALL
jgi:hypothetical protein